MLEVPESSGSFFIYVYDTNRQSTKDTDTDTYTIGAYAGFHSRYGALTFADHNLNGVGTNHLARSRAIVAATESMTINPMSEARTVPFATIGAHRQQISTLSVAAAALRRRS